MKNKYLNREFDGISRVLCLGSSYIILDTLQSTTIYASSYYNNGSYPISLTSIVAITEWIKLLVFFALTQFKLGVSNVKFAWKFAIPSIIYAINNNLHYLALIYTTPPVWTALMQLRLIMTAAVYRLIFGRKLQVFQIVGLILLFSGVLLSLFISSTETFSVDNFNMPFVIIIALIASSLSTAGSIFMEFLFKNDRRSFLEMQLQFYLFGFFICTGICMVTNLYKPFSWTVDKAENERMLSVLLAVTIVTGVLSGSVIALVMKQLDNVVKIYVQNLGNIANSIVCFIVFPDRFRLSVEFFICLLFILIGIYLYERKTVVAKSRTKPINLDLEQVI